MYTDIEIKKYLTFYYIHFYLFSLSLLQLSFRSMNM